jgi:hypothetical protein
MSEHDFSPSDQRCIHCGTLREHHENKPQLCPRRVEAPTSLCPEPAQREYAADDQNTIADRLAELHAEKTAGLNRKEEA